MTAITRDSAKKHYVMTGILVKGSLKNNSSTWGTGGFYITFYDSNEKSVDSYNVFEQINAGQTVNVSKTIVSKNAMYKGETATWYVGGSSSVNITGSLNSLTIQYGSKADPSISSSFKGGYLNPAKTQAITFTSNTIDLLYEQYTITGGVFYYKTEDASTYQSIAFTGTSVTLPVGTLTTGQTYNAYADITVDDGTIVTVNLADISTVDAIPTVTPTSPINTVLYGEATFVWSYSVSTGADQLAYDIETSSDGQTWATLADHIESAESTYTSAITTSGTIYWRVRGYNQDDVASEWSDAVSFVNNIPPEPPVITSVTSSGRPIISWSAADQIAYQVQILSGDIIVEDSNTVYSSAKQYRAKEYLPEGTYTIRVRIFNYYGKSSDWAETVYSQSVTLTAPTFTLAGSDNGIVINIDVDPTFAVYYIQRNGVAIGQTTSGSYVDRFANGTVTYTVIGVTTADDSAQSTRTITYVVSSNMLISTTGQVFLVNHRMGSPVGVTKQVNATYDQVKYIGAALPEHHFARLIDGRFSVIFKDYVQIEQLLGETMFYADMYGNGAWVAVVSVGRAESRFGNETTAELQLTQYGEEISYA